MVQIEFGSDGKVSTVDEYSLQPLYAFAMLYVYMYVCIFTTCTPTCKREKGRILNNACMYSYIEGGQEDSREAAVYLCGCELLCHFLRRRRREVLLLTHT